MDASQPAHRAARRAAATEPATAPRHRAEQPTSPTAAPLHPIHVGPRLRNARRELRLSLRGLATLTGFSASFLSQAERGEVSPSLGSLQRICAALSIELPDLLRDPARAKPGPVVRRAERGSLRSEWSKASAEPIVTADPTHPISAMLLTLDRRGRTGPILRPAGSSAFAYCLHGSVTVTLDGIAHRITAGDCVVLDDSSGAAWENTGRSKAQVLWVSARLPVTVR